MRILVVMFLAFVAAATACQPPYGEPRKRCSVKVLRYKELYPHKPGLYRYDYRYECL